ncbi:hypothetical protein T439DRAFT_379683 [Meredithblackwellia eburnea MCA 4105]
MGARLLISPAGVFPPTCPRLGSSNPSISESAIRSPRLASPSLTISSCVTTTTTTISKYSLYLPLLPPEVWSEVIRLAVDEPSDRTEWTTRNASLVRLAKVSRSWTGYAYRELYGHIHIYWRRETCKLLNRSLRGNPALAPMVLSVRAFFVQALDLLEPQVADIERHVPCCHQNVWLHEFPHQRRQAEDYETFIQRMIYRLAHDRLRLSHDGPWLMDKDGPVLATERFFTLVTNFRNLKRLELDQFLDHLQYGFSEGIRPGSFASVRELAMKDCSSRLFDYLHSRMTSLNFLDFDFRRFTDMGDDERQYEDEEQDAYSTPEDEGDDSEYGSPARSSPPAPPSPSPKRGTLARIVASPSLRTFKSGWAGGRITRSFINLVAGSHIATLHLADPAAGDLVTLPRDTSFPSVTSLHLDLNPNLKGCFPFSYSFYKHPSFGQYSDTVALAFPNLTHWFVVGWSSSDLGNTVNRLPPSLLEINIDLRGKKVNPDIMEDFFDAVDRCHSTTLRKVVFRAYACQLNRTQLLSVRAEELRNKKGFNGLALVLDLEDVDWLPVIE